MSNLNFLEKMQTKNKFLLNAFVKLTLATLIVISNLDKVHAKDAVDWRIESDIPIEQCDIKTISFFYAFNNTRKQAEYAKARIPLIDEQLKLIEKLPNKNQQVGEQFNKEQYSKFNQNREKQISISLQTLLESNRTRDIEVIEHILQIADKNYRFNTEILDKKHSDYIFQTLF